MPRLKTYISVQNWAKLLLWSQPPLACFLAAIPQVLKQLLAKVSRKWWSSHVFLPSAWRKLVSAFVAKKPSLKLLFQHCLEISIRVVQNATEKRVCPIYSSCHQISNNWQLRWSTNDQVKNMVAALSVHGQRVGYNSFTLAWTPRYFPFILLAPS